MAKTVIMGASTNPTRYAYMAFNDLRANGHEVVPVSIKKGTLHGTEFLDLREKPAIEDVHTVTLYIGVYNLTPWIAYILSLNPERIIFNPGTENPELIELAEEAGVETVIGCTLIMLRTRTF
ncbi:MAG: CoA-binding protein [Cyclobacteriaceae bacterium]